MYKCKNCIHFKFEDEITHPKYKKTTMGRCLSDPLRTAGNYTFGDNDSACTCFQGWEPKYKMGDVFKGRIEKHVNFRTTAVERVVFITEVNPEFYPNIYRVSDNWGSKYSMSEKQLDNFEIIELQEVR